MMRVTKGAMVVARGKKTGTLYVNSNYRSTIMVTDNTVSSNFWHYKLAHMSEKWIKVLLLKGSYMG